MPPVRFVLIGCGHIAARHLNQIARNGQLAGLCDTNAQVLLHQTNIYKVPGYISLDALLKVGPIADVAVVCTPNGLHFTHARQLLEHGYHVLVEKPMVLNTADAERLWDVAKSQHKYLFTVLQNRFNAPIKWLYNVLKNGSFGKLFSVQVNCFWNRDSAYYDTSEWHGRIAMDGGVLFTQFSHFIDLLLWLFGPVKEVSALMHNVNHAHTELREDEGSVLISFENGMIGTLQFSTNSFKKNMEGSLTLLAEKGTVKIGGTYLNEISYLESEVPAPIHQPTGDTFEQVYDSLIRTLQNNQPYYTSVEESIAVIRLIESIYNTAENKK